MYNSKTKCVYICTYFIESTFHNAEYFSDALFVLDISKNKLYLKQSFDLRGQEKKTKLN